MTSISKNVYIDKLDNTVNRYNNTYHKKTKIKPVDVKLSTYIKIKIVNLKLAIYLEYQNIKRFLQNSMFQIGLKKFSWLNKLKTLFRWHMFLVILKKKKLLKRFTKKNHKKTNQKEFRVEKSNK